MTFIVICNNEKTESDDPKSANEYALNTGLGFPDVVIIDTETDSIDEIERFLK